MDLMGIKFSPSMLCKLIEPDNRLASSCDTGEFRMKSGKNMEKESPASSLDGENILSQYHARKSKKVRSFETTATSSQKKKKKGQRKAPKPELLKREKKSKGKMISVKLKKAAYYD